MSDYITRYYKGLSYAVPNKRYWLVSIADGFVYETADDPAELETSRYTKVIESPLYPKHFDGPASRCEKVGHDWRPKMDGPECLRCGARQTEPLDGREEQ